MAGTDKNINIVIPTQSANFRAAEAYKTLRSNIQFCGADNKVILLTSSIPNEGKTTVSIMLAAAFAEMGKKVLLIDADLRKSVLMKKLQINVKRLRGLSHYLSGQQELSDVIYVTNVPNLHLVLTGPVPPNPAELLGSELMGRTLEALRRVYDYILIDTPPLGSVIDSAVLAQYCDGAVLVIDADTVSYRLAQKVKDQLEKSGCRILGAVLNKAPVDKKSLTGKYYYKYYYGDYQNKYLEAAKETN